MFVLKMEHQVPSYENWKARAFDADPLGRKAMGVKRYRIARAVDDPNRVSIELDFDSADAASRMAEALRKMWVGAQERGLIGPPTLTAYEQVEANEV